VLPLLWNIVGESLREALRGLSTDETAILAKALHRVIANLSALDRRTAPGLHGRARKHELHHQPVHQAASLETLRHKHRHLLNAGPDNSC